MKEMMSVNLEVKLFKYASEKEMKEHVEIMIKDGWECRRKGECMFKPSSLVSEFCNENNWEWSAEFSIQNEIFTLDKPTSYESTVYFFSIYDPKE